MSCVLTIGEISKIPGNCSIPDLTQRAFPWHWYSQDHLWQNMLTYQHPLMKHTFKIPGQRSVFPCQSSSSPQVVSLLLQLRCLLQFLFLNSRCEDFVFVVLHKCFSHFSNLIPNCELHQNKCVLGIWAIHVKLTWRNNITSRRCSGRQLLYELKSNLLYFHRDWSFSRIQLKAN